MSGGHHRCRPERQNKAEVNRMANEAVERGRRKLRVAELLSAEICINLLQPKEPKMADQARTD